MNLRTYEKPKKSKPKLTTYLMDCGHMYSSDDKTFLEIKPHIPDMIETQLFCRTMEEYSNLDKKIQLCHIIKTIYSKTLDRPVYILYLIDLDKYAFCCCDTFNNISEEFTR